MSSITVFWKKKERPKSRCAADHSQSINCRVMGRFSPYWMRTSSMAAEFASGPAMAAAKSPDRWSSMKLTTATVNMTLKATSRRRKI